MTLNKFSYFEWFVRRQLAWQDLFLGSSLNPSSPWLYFDVLREAECPPVEHRVDICVCGGVMSVWGDLQKKTDCMLSISYIK